MKSYVALIFIAALPLNYAPAHASPELAAMSSCMACHDMEKKKLGPTFKDISAKYKMGLGCGKGDAEAMLTDSILRGSRDRVREDTDAAAKDPPRGRANTVEVDSGLLTY